MTTGLYINQGTVVQFMQWELNRAFKASLWPSTPNHRDQITKTSIPSLPTKAITHVSHASWCALEWDSAPVSTCRSGDYIQGFRRGKEAVIWNCCVLLLCTFLNAMLSCSIRWCCMTGALQEVQLFWSYHMSVASCFVSWSFHCSVFLVAQQMLGVSVLPFQQIQQAY